MMIDKRLFTWAVLVLVWFGYSDARSQPDGSTLYVSVLETKGFIVGSDNPASGMYRLDGDGSWTHLGWQNTRNFGIDIDPARPTEIFLACGNGVIRSLDAGENWRVTTGWRITEVLDISLDRNQAGRAYIATAHGLWKTEDGGETWEETIDGLMRPRDTFTQSVEADVSTPGHVLAGSEVGLFESTDSGESWSLVGPKDIAIRDLKQSASSPDVWIAGTEDRGVLLSQDNGQTWKPAKGKIGKETVFAVAIDPSNPKVMAAAGFHTGVYFTTNGGRSWKKRSKGEETSTIHALRFDDDGALWVGTVGKGVYSTPDLGKSWMHRGLEGAVIYDMIFIDEVR